jgi:hypothetical protein
LLLLLLVLVGVELRAIDALSGVEGRELMGLPRLGVVARTGVAVRDGSTLAIGVISVPMSRVETLPLVLLLPGEEEPTAAPAAAARDKSTAGTCIPP